MNWNEFAQQTATFVVLSIHLLTAIYNGPNVLETQLCLGIF